MMCYSEKRSKNFWIKKAIFVPIAIAAGVFAFGILVMYLWNSILPVVFGLNTITFWQAIGILVLSKILFGGFGRGHGYSQSGRSLKGYHMNINPEERGKMREEWRNRCRTEPKAEE